MADLTRPVSVVPQIVEAPLESPARGFTEVKIIGVGGGGSNAVNRMVETGSRGSSSSPSTPSAGAPDVVGDEKADHRGRSGCEKVVTKTRVAAVQVEHKRRVRPTGVHESIPGV